jgi:hypothetical protein
MKVHFTFVGYGCITPAIEPNPTLCCIATLTSDICGMVSVHSVIRFLICAYTQKNAQMLVRR